jgi:serine/threonine protein phosphatase PrpC
VVRDRDFAKDAYLVLACDGVWDVMSNNEVAEIVVKQMATKAETNTESLTEVADYIVQECIKSGDNISLLILSLRGKPSRVGSPEVLPGVVSHVDSPQKA